MSHMVIERMYDVEEENRGWTIDVLNLYIDGIAAGRASIQNISYENFDRFYPSGAYSFARIHKTECRSYPEDINDLDPNILAKSNLFYNRSRESLKISDFEKMSIDKKLSFFEKLIQKEYNQFKNYHVGRPFFAYVEVYDDKSREKIYTLDTDGRKTVDFLERKGKSYNGMGLGKILYVESALMMEEQGYSLYKSGLLSPTAEKMWEKLEREYPDALVKGERKLQGKECVSIDVSKIENYIPDWITSIDYTTRTNADNVKLKSPPSRKRQANFNI